METIKDLDFIATIAKLILKVVTGGPVYWIATGVLLLIGVIGVFLINRYIKKKNWEASQRKGQQNEADNVEKEKEVSEDLEESNKELEEAKKENPLPQDKPPMKIIEEEEEK